MLLRNGINGNSVPIQLLGGGFMPAVHGTDLPTVFVGGFDAVSAIPNGRNHPRAILMAVRAGGMATHNNIVGAGRLSADAVPARNATATLSGAGDLSGAGQLIVSMAASLSGSGTISQAQLQAFLQLSASLSGSGDLTADINAIGHMAAELAGVGDIDAVATATGSMSASITAAGSALTTANVGNAVLDALNGVEDDWTLRQALRIILAALGGKVSISGSTVTFRDVNDTTDRITATTDENGQRTVVTLDAD